MEHKDSLEIPTARVEQPSGDATSDTEYLQVTPEQRQELLSLLQLAEQVKGALTPVKPSASYKKKFESELAQMARRRAAKEVHLAPSAHTELVIGAAIGSAAALVGGIAYLIRSRIQTRSQHVGQVGT